jgi:hypothetical protein
MRLPWKKQVDPGEPQFSKVEFPSRLCDFCRKAMEAYEYEGHRFCSRWCINYYILNGRAMATRCAGCGWRGCDVDFNPTLELGVVYPLCNKPHGGQPACWQGITDEEFEEYRTKILTSLGAH